MRKRLIAMALMITMVLTGALSSAPISWAETLPSAEEESAETTLSVTGAALETKLPVTGAAVETPTLVTEEALEAPALSPELSQALTETVELVTTDDLLGVTNWSATLSGTVHTSEAFGRGIVFGTHENPTLEDFVATVGMAINGSNETWEGSYTATLTGLKPDTTYHARAYRTYSGGTEYGRDLTFTTEDGAEMGWTDLSANLPATAQGNTALPRMSFINDQEGWIAQSITGYLYHTTDGGITFETVATLPLPPTGNGLYGIQSVAFRNSLEGYIGYSQVGIYRTLDGGLTWKKISNSVGTPMKIQLLPDTDRGYVCGYNGPYNFGFLKRIDGDTLTSIPLLGTEGDALAMTMNDVSILPSGEGYCAGAEAMIHIKGDSNAWDESCPHGYYGCVDMADEKLGWSGGGLSDWYDDTLVAMTTDGRVWIEKPTPEGLKSEEHPREVYAVDFLDRKNGFFSGFKGLILQTADGGNSWNFAADRLAGTLLTDVKYTSEDCCYVLGNEGTLLKYGPIDGTGPQPKPVTGVTLNKSTLSLKMAENAQLTAAVLPADADNRAVHWSVSDSSVLSVTDGKVTALKTGTATVRAASDENEALYAECLVTVTASSTGDEDNGNSDGTSPRHHTASTATVEEENTPLAIVFTDVSGHWAENDIYTLVSKGAINGYGDGTFRPNARITRAEFATMIVKAFGLEKRSTKTFPDCEKHWAKDDIATAASWDVIRGYDAGHFRPNELISREQMAAMIHRAALLRASDPELKSVAFRDKINIANWALKDVEAAVTRSLMKGYPDASFQPKGYTTRAEAVTVICNALK